MFEIGFWEIVVVVIVAIWVLGPEKLPAVARVCGRYLARAKHSFEVVKNEIEQEFKPAPPKQSENDSPKPFSE